MEHSVTLVNEGDLNIVFTASIPGSFTFKFTVQEPKLTTLQIWNKFIESENVVLCFGGNSSSMILKCNGKYAFQTELSGVGNDTDDSIELDINFDDQLRKCIDELYSE